MVSRICEGFASFLLILGKKEEEDAVFVVIDAVGHSPSFLLVFGLLICKFFLFPPLFGGSGE